MAHQVTNTGSKEVKKTDKLYALPDAVRRQRKQHHKVKGKTIQRGRYDLLQEYTTGKGTGVMVGRCSLLRIGETHCSQVASAAPQHIHYLLETPKISGTTLDRLYSQTLHFNKLSGRFKHALKIDRETESNFLLLAATICSFSSLSLCAIHIKYMCMDGNYGLCILRYIVAI